jgi:RNA polymerase sigma-70 factor (ECF subfamily)
MRISGDLDRFLFAAQPTRMAACAPKLEELDPVSQRGSTPVGARPTDAVLVGAARGGERWAKEALFRRHAPLAMGLAYRLLGSDADLEDVVQEAYFQALSNLQRLKDSQAFASWLAGIVVRRVQQLLRHRRVLSRLGLRQPVPIDPDLSLSSTTPPEVMAELGRIYAVVDQLSTQARLVLLLRRVDGYSLPEIATMLNCSLSTAKRRMLEAERVLLVYQEGGA